jgi:isopenicillin-N N-acyltransferase-like protein
VKRFPLVEIEGEAYERGRQYGAQIALALRQSVKAYLRLFEFHTGLGHGAALEAAGAFGTPIQTHAADLLLEMQGIADGAGCDLSHVLLINARSELMSQAGECTALGATVGVTSQGQVLLGQNWDWYTSIEVQPILLRIRQPNKPEILTLVEAGQVAKIGLNRAGLGVCLNFLDHRDQGQGLPVHVILRRVLECETLGQAAQAALNVPRAGAANLMLAHAEGEILDLELTAADADFLYADGGWLVHANHFESRRLRGGDAGLATSVSTLARAARARRLLDSARGRVSMETLKAILSDHAYGAGAICRHPDSDEPWLQQTKTHASMILDLSARMIYLAAGQPCREGYQAITFDSACTYAGESAWRHICSDGHQGASGAAPSSGSETGDCILNGGIGVHNAGKARDT